MNLLYVLSERSQTQKAIYDIQEKAKLLGQKTDEWFPGLGVKKELITKGHEGTFLGTLLYRDCGVCVWQNS